MTSPSENDSPITNINVTPLVDVSLVLVIIFMAVAPFVMQAGIKAAQSKEGAAKGKTAAGENVSLELNEQGAVKLNGRDIAWETLPGILQEAILKSRDRLVSLSAAKNVQVGKVVELLDLAKQNGARKLAIMQKQEPEEKINVIPAKAGIQAPQAPAAKLDTGFRRYDKRK